MKVSIFRRIEALEKQARKAATPEAIMIDYDSRLEKWVISPRYCDTNQHKSASRYEATVDRLQDYFFPADFSGCVIMDTFSSPDPDIYGNLFCFDIDDLREGQKGEVCIVSIKEPNGNSNSAEIVTGWKED